MKWGTSFSERVALYLGACGFDRLEVFRTVKDIYNVRSKLVHGDTLSEKQIATLPQLATTGDGYLRAILDRIFSSASERAVFDSRNENIEEYFTSLLFGKLSDV